MKEIDKSLTRRKLDNGTEDAGPSMDVYAASQPRPSTAPPVATTSLRNVDPNGELHAPSPQSASSSVAALHGKPLRLRGWAKSLSPATAELLVALVRGDAEGAREAIFRGADVNTRHKDRWNTSALHLAGLQPDPDCLFVMMNDVPVKAALVANDSGQTVFHAVARNTNSALTLPLLLIAYGPQPTIDVYGRSYMHELMDNTQLPLTLLCGCTEHMLRHGDAKALLNVRDRFFQTVLDVAVHRRRPHEGELHELLLRFGGKRGVEVDTTVREYTVHEERRGRNALVADEESSWHDVTQRIRIQREEAEQIARRHRQFVRLLEREELERAELGAQRQEELDGLTLTLVVEQRSLVRMLEVMREDRAITKLQCRWRQILATRLLAVRRKLRDESERAVTKLQRWWRHHQDRNYMLRSRASRRIQKWYRNLRHRAALQAVLSGELTKRQAAALRIFVAYRRYRNACRLEIMERERLHHVGIWAVESHRAYIANIVKIQSWYRMLRAKRQYGHDHKSLVLLQLHWRARQQSRHERRERILTLATSRVKDALIKRKSMNLLRVHVHELHRRAELSVVDRTTATVTRVLWREVFTRLYRSALHKRNRWWWRSASERHGTAASTTTIHVRRLAKIAGVLQMMLVVGLLVTFAVVPRGDVVHGSRSYEIWRGIDLGAISLIFLMVFPALDTWWWMEMGIILAALCCVIFPDREESRMVIGALLFKMPFVIRSLKSRHRGSDTFCTCVDLTLQWFLRLLPISLVALTASVRAVQWDSQLITSNSIGRWPGVLLSLTHPAASLMTTCGENADHSLEVLTKGSMQWDHWTYPLSHTISTNSTGGDVGCSAVPLISISTLWFGVWMHSLLSVLLGVTQAFQRRHVELLGREAASLSVKDRRKLRRSHLKRSDDTSVEALTWDDDIAAAKAAMELAHYDHNVTTSATSQTKRQATSLVFTRDDDEGIESGSGTFADLNSPNATIEVGPDDVRRGAAGVSPLSLSRSGRDRGSRGVVAMMLVGSKNAAVQYSVTGPSGMDEPWDLRNESRYLRHDYDVQVITTSLTHYMPMSSGESFWFRQWQLPPLHCVSSIAIVIMVACSAAFPGLFWMEVGFSVALFVELVLSFKYLGASFVLSHGYGRGILSRLFCILVGCVPQARWLTTLRVVRLLEGWHQVFALSPTHVWCLAYALFYWVLLWGLGLLSVFQTRANSGESFLGCTDSSSLSDCINSFTLAFLLPSIAEHGEGGHLPPRLPPVAAACIVAARWLCIPFLVAMALHASLGSFTATSRFVRHLVYSFHNDVVKCWRCVVAETDEWLAHRHLSTAVTYAVRATVGHQPASSSSSGHTPGSDTATAAPSLPLPPAATPARGNSSTINVLEEDMPLPLPLTQVTTVLKPSMIAKLQILAQKSRRRCRSRGVVLSKHQKSVSNAAVPWRANSEGEREDDQPLLLQRSVPKSHEQNYNTDHGVPDAFSGVVLRRLVRLPALHFFHAVVTMTSLAFLWAHSGSRYSSTTPPNVSRSMPHVFDGHAPTWTDVLAVVELAVHGVSILTSIMFVPRDVSSILTGLGTGGLVTSLVLYHAFDAADVYGLRFVSFLRLAQLHGSIQRTSRFILQHVIHHLVWPVTVLFFCVAIACLATRSFYQEHDLWVSSTSFESIHQAARESLKQRLQVMLPSDLTTIGHAVHYYLLPVIAIGTALGSSKLSTPYETRVDAIALYTLTHDDPIVQYRPVWFRGSQTFHHCIQFSGKCLVLLFGMLWPIVASRSVAYSSEALDFGKIFYTVEVSGCAAIVMYALETLMFCVRRCLFSVLSSVGSTVYSSRSGGPVVLGDRLLLLKAQHDVAACGWAGVRCGFWCVHLTAAVLLYLEQRPAVVAFATDEAYSGLWTPIRMIWLLDLVPRHVWRLGVLRRWRLWVGVVLAAAVYMCCSVAVVTNLLPFSGAVAFNSLYARTFDGFMRLVMSATLPGGVPMRADSSLADGGDGVLWPYALNGSSSSSSALWIAVLLAWFGKIVLSVLSGVLLGAMINALRSSLPDPNDLTDLPKQAQRLHQALCRGAQGICEASFEKSGVSLSGGSTLNTAGVDRSVKEDSMHLVEETSGTEDGFVSQRQKLILDRFATFSNEDVVGSAHVRGIPRYLLKCLLEEIGVLFPALERRRYHALLELLVCLPLMSHREEYCEAYCNGYEEYASGGPGQLPTGPIPSYDAVTSLRGAPRTGNDGDKEGAHSAKVKWGAFMNRERHHLLHYGRPDNIISCSRLVEAVAWCEAEFPISTSVDAVSWMSFFVLQRRVRAALQLQSLWRMYRQIQIWEGDSKVTRRQRVAAEVLRQRFRYHQQVMKTKFFSSCSMEDAIRTSHIVYSCDPLSAGVLDRLRGRGVFADLSTHGIQHPPGTGPQYVHETSPRAEKRITGGKFRFGSQRSPFASRMDGSGSFTVHPSVRIRPQTSSGSIQGQTANRRYAGIDAALGESGAASRPSSPQFHHRSGSEAVGESRTESSSSTTSSSLSASASNTQRYSRETKASTAAAAVHSGDAASTRVIDSTDTPAPRAPSEARAPGYNDET